MDNDTVNDIIQALEAADYSVRSYSGRGMYGRSCVGVVIPRGESLIRIGVVLGAALGDDALDLEERTDSMGLDTIVYWPSLRWPDGSVQSDED
jgi:hypothetical protein